MDLAYHRNSNILTAQDHSHSGFDSKYTMDTLDRLTVADGGTLSGGCIASRTRKEDWTLSQVGNWAYHRLSLDGDSTFGGAGEPAGELDETNTFNLANELKARDTNSSSPAEFTLTYDKAGNLTDDGEDYTYEYDAFGRLRKVKNRTTPFALVAEYTYNGLGQRIGWHYDVDADGTVENNSDDPWYRFVYDDGWRVIAVYRGSDSAPKEQFVYHAAGLGAFGGSCYIDAVILRDRDANTAWASASDGTLEERRAYTQNWRGDVSAVLTGTGKMVEWVKYSSYGVPFGLPSGDTNSDGDWDSGDSSSISDGEAPYDVRRDADLDGDADSADITHANGIVNGYQTLGRGVLSSTGVNSRKGYAGYERDPTFHGAGRHLHHVRYRVYDADLGRWTRRDPQGYVDGMSLYAYVQGLAIIAADPMGLDSSTCSSCVDAGPPEEDQRWHCIDASHTFSECVYKCCDGAGPWCREACDAKHAPPPPPPVPVNPGPPPLIVGCPLTAPGANVLGDGWCYSGKSDEHCGLFCYRSIPNGTTGGQQCCYDSKGRLVTDPKCAGTIDRYAPSDGEKPDGTCNTVDDYKHWRDYYNWRRYPHRYNEIQCCLREKGIPSGTPGCGVTDDDLYNESVDCANRYNAGERWCWKITPWSDRPFPDEFPYAVAAY